MSRYRTPGGYSIFANLRFSHLWRGMTPEQRGGGRKPYPLPWLTRKPRGRWWRLEQVLMQRRSQKRQRPRFIGIKEIKDLGG